MYEWRRRKRKFHWCDHLTIFCESTNAHKLKLSCLESKLMRWIRYFLNIEIIKLSQVHSKLFQCHQNSHEISTQFSSATYSTATPSSEKWERENRPRAKLKLGNPKKKLFSLSRKLRVYMRRELKIFYRRVQQIHMKIHDDDCFWFHFCTSRFCFQFPFFSRINRS